MKNFSLFLLMLLLSFPVIAKQDKGKGAGGVRDDHAGEMGLEKGEAWAGSKEKKENLYPLLYHHNFFFHFYMYLIYCFQFYLLKKINNS